MHMRLFRAQRNFYISGFALFLCLVVRRLVSLISVSATLEAEKEAAMKQAASASRYKQYKFICAYVPVVSTRHFINLTQIVISKFFL